MNSNKYYRAKKEKPTIKERGTMKYNLYTFYSSKLIWTETENIKDALKNFRERLNLDHNGYYHPEMIYNFKYPMYVVTKENEKKEYIIGYETDKLTNKIICN